MELGREISKLYEYLLGKLVEILNLFWIDRESFAEYLLRSSDNNISKLNIVVFDPLSPDTYINEIDISRLQVVFSKRRWRARWGERNRARYLLIGFNDDGSIYSHILDYRDIHSRVNVFGYQLDLYQFDELDDGSIVIPYDIAVRIQGDLVITRLRPIELRESIDIDTALPCEDIDQELSRYTKIVRFTPSQIASIKISAKNLCRRGSIPRFSIKSYHIEGRDMCRGQRGFYRIHLAWVGGARHTVEYFGCEPIYYPNTVRFMVLDKYLTILHPVHKTVRLRMEVGDVVEFRAIEQRIDILNLVLESFSNISLESIDYPREIARLLIARYGETKLLYYSVFEDPENVFSRLMRYTSRTILRFVLDRDVIEWLKRYIEMYRSFGQEILSNLPSYINGDYSDKNIAAYIMWIALKTYNSYWIFEEFNDVVSKGYKAVSIPIDKLVDNSINIRFRYRESKNRSIMKMVISIARKCEELGKRWSLLCDEYICPYICMENRYCINI
ncbi:hypothetical protein Igag_1362 [Ignisphaera aggregans DSM 17230]|uniref:Uncharacterized protein n=1 Tax=Ignisphaera aggregans (strain DSM 17230 / JCM 13409 / AQ1.S1) TaxID=583356 RepID=E0SQ34_IGNAA|nr:hypothetical protein Igag_1362 [Ignisphaera aggregans DSM 17230]